MLKCGVFGGFGAFGLINVVLQTVLYVENARYRDIIVDYYQADPEVQPVEAL